MNYLLFKYVKYDSTRKQYNVPIIINIALYSEIFFDLNNNIIYNCLYLFIIGTIALFFIDRFYRFNLNRVFLSKISRHQ